MVTRPIPHISETGEIGAFEFVDRGPTTIIACGMYQIADVCAFKGFIPKSKDETWQTLLHRYRNLSKIPYFNTHVESWVEAMAKNHTGTINVFENRPKVIDLNCDTKRTWDKPVRGRDLLATIQKSIPLTIVEHKKPTFWT
jgi:hypothetical protein